MQKSRDQHPNAHLLGMPGSRQRLATPALLLDLVALERNIARMAAHCAGHGLGLRPHGKTHKCGEIARMQIAAGASGIGAATLDEAEAFAASGIAGVLVTSPQFGPGRAERLAGLALRAREPMAVVDHVAQIEALEAALKAAGAPPLRVLVDIDLGMHRTGVATIEGAMSLVRRLRASPVLVYAGLQAYAGDMQHVADLEERCRRAAPQMAFLRRLVVALSDAGMKPRVVSGGGTGTHAIDPAFGIFTELQAGSYVFMDVDYNRVQFEAGANRPPFETSLFVRASVISANHPEHVTTDAGSKRFAMDGPPPEPVGLAGPATYRCTGDEHGRIVFGRAADRLSLGDQVEFVTPHCDPTVNLYDWYHCVRGDTLVDLWPIDAR
ncbi:MAG: DSD1 family PLP-dependent enzyme [Alphaproteobacteria bacterium]|nr:DSD1 family PLP-dependent enzyme [Alphaproteobacteria bacterium]